MPRVLLASLVALLLLAPAAEAQTSLGRSLSRAMAHAGSGASAYAIDADSGQVLYSRRATSLRTLASNTKLFTSAAAFGRIGAKSSIATTLLGTGTLRSDGTWDGNLFLRGGGDPTFGARSFTRGYGSSANVEEIAATLARAGFKSVTGHIYGDESAFDSVRGVYDSGGATSSWIGPLSALDFDHGYGGSRFLTNPPAYAAQKLDSALAHVHIGVRGQPGVKPAPSGARLITEVRSPSVAKLIRLQDKDSDNFFAEMLMKGLALSGDPRGPDRASGAPLPTPPVPGAPEPAVTPVQPLPPATTAAGIVVATRFAHKFGARPHLVDGSGLSRPDRASPRSIVRLLAGMRKRSDFRSFYAALPIAGRDGTLDNRMRSGPAHGHCHAKTGTLTGVSALSGYCTTRSGRTVAFSILMNRVGNLNTAHAIQDRMAQAIAGWRG